MAVEKRSETALHTIAQPLKSGVYTSPPPKKTTSESNTCDCLQTYSVPPSPTVLERASANTRVIDADGG